MNIHDLMAGDLVYYVTKPDGLKEQQETAVVVGINTITEQVYLWLDGYYKWVNATEVEPIPMTTEMIEKFGFKYSHRTADGRIEYNLESEDCKSTLTAIPYASHAVLQVETSRDIFLNFAFNMAMKVHDFQHAHRLCGLREFADNIKLEQ